TALIGEQLREIQDLRAQNNNLVVENRLLSDQVEQLQQQLQLNTKPTDSTIFVCPICVETAANDVLALMCGHVLCRNCYRGVRTRMERGTSPACPECRNPNVDEFIELHLH
ncbi:hypothetical protein BpHYR1_000051, partial [Brachionus plicatilis]